MKVKIDRRKLISLASVLAMFLAMAACKFFSTPTAVVPTGPAVPTGASSQPSTSTPAPEPAATIEPTPTPEGFYYNGPAGFSFIAPTSWSMDEEGTSYVAMKSDGFTFYMEGLAASQPASLDDYIAEVAPAIFGDYTYETGDPFEVKIGNGLTAQAKDLTTTLEDGTRIVVRMIYLYANYRSYRIAIISDEATMQSSDSLLKDLYASMEFFAPAMYGLDKSKTYTEIGSDPIDPQDLDPAMSTSGAGGYPGLVFSGLVRLGNDLQIVPDLAKDLTISPDGTVYTFTLRDDIRFASGRPITAQDFKDSWERALDPATDSSVAMTYLGDILGAKEKNAGAASEVTGIKVVDDHTLEVTLDGPKPYFLAKLTYPTSFVVDGAEAKNDKWYYQANASGPYKIKEYEPDKYIIFERNDAYWNPPAIPNVLFLFNPGGSTLSMYEEGTLDMVPIWGDDVIRIRKPEDPLHAELQSSTSMCTSMVMFNNTKPPFDDINVRKAFAMAIDKNALIERMSNNIDAVANSILPPAMPGYQDSNRGASYDKTAAQETLASSKYGANLPEVKLSVGGYGDSESPLVNALVSMWKDVLGVNVKVEYLDPVRFNEAAREQANPMTLYGWCADYPDPQNFLDVLFHSGSDFNASAYSNPQVDKLLEQAGVEQDSAKRIALYQQAEDMLLKDVAALPYMYDVSNVLVKPRVQGFKLMPMNSPYIPSLSLQDN